MARVEPRDDWARVLAGLIPGEEMVLAPGDHPGGWRITRGGTPGAPLVLRSEDPEVPARLCAPERGAVIDVRADHVTLRGVHIGPTPASVHAVVLSGVHGVTIEACQFDGIGGLAIVQTIDGDGVAVRGNRIRASRATAMYFGCHTGQCSVTGLVIEGNEIDGVTAPWRDIGYGIQVKLNSSATIRGNVIQGTKGPGIMVYGAGGRGKLQSIVEHNTVLGSRSSAGIVVGGGPAVVRSNVAAHHADVGIAVEDYGGRGLLRAVGVHDNTVYGNRRGGIAVRAGIVDATIVGNVVHARRGTPALPAPRPGLHLARNVDCSGGACHG